MFSQQFSIESEATTMHSVNSLFWSVLFPLILISSALEYSNRWAVKIDGDNNEANRLARKYGFVNNGKVRLAYCLEKDIL